MSKEINLTEPTTIKLPKDTTITVYPASLEKLTQVSPMLDNLNKFEDEGELESQVTVLTEIVHLLVKEDNPGMSQETLRAVLTLEAGMEIMRIALGSSVVNMSVQES